VIEEQLQDLPKYETPPVIEVVCGVQFEPIANFLSVHYGDFWQRIKRDYPTPDDKPPLDDLRETSEGTQLKAELMPDLPPQRRVFYIDPSGNFLLQVQPSRFLSNWRKRGPSDEYPSYVVAFSRFLDGWNTFLDFANGAGFSLPRTNQYELTYINHIPEDEHPFPRGIEQYLPLFSWGSAQATKFLSAPQRAGIRLGFALPESRGRLHVTIAHGVRKDDNKSVLIIELTARGPAQPDWSDMKEWFSVAHEWIVCGFTDLTSSTAHLKWGRIK
jgi:uncharacterized protein (TIGR04255 family)